MASLVWGLLSSPVVTTRDPSACVTIDDFVFELESLLPSHLSPIISIVVEDIGGEQVHIDLSLAASTSYPVMNRKVEITRSECTAVAALLARVVASYVRDRLPESDLTPPLVKEQRALLLIPWRPLVEAGCGLGFSNIEIRGDVLAGIELGSKPLPQLFAAIQLSQTGPVKVGRGRIQQTSLAAVLAAQGLFAWDDFWVAPHLGVQTGAIRAWAIDFTDPGRAWLPRIDAIANVRLGYKGFYSAIGIEIPLARIILLVKGTKDRYTGPRVVSTLHFGYAFGSLKPPEE